MRVSRLLRELIGVLGIGAEVSDWEPKGRKCGALSTSACSGVEEGREDWGEL